MFSEPAAECTGFRIISIWSYSCYFAPLFILELITVPSYFRSSDAEFGLDNDSGMSQPENYLWGLTDLSIMSAHLGIIPSNCIFMSLKGAACKSECQLICVANGTNCFIHKRQNSSQQSQRNQGSRGSPSLHLCACLAQQGCVMKQKLGLLDPVVQDPWIYPLVYRPW